MSSDLESPFLDRDIPLFSRDGEDRADPSGEYENPFAEAESPFGGAEAEEASLFGGELERHDEETAGENLLYESPELERADGGAAWEAPPGEPEAWEWEQAEDEREADAEEGEITYVGSEVDEMDEAGAGERAFGSHEDLAPNTNRIQARILWPALGFPAVIAPTPGSRKTASLVVDATRCITVLLLCDKSDLSKADAARYLRVVRWDERARRHIAANLFRPEDLVLRSDKLRFPAPVGKDNEVIAFGGDADRAAVVVNLPTFVRDLYAKARMTFLYEIRVSEEASARLLGSDETTAYHVFWNNHRVGEDAPSDEMALLLQSAARASREKDAKVWMASAPGPIVQAQERKKWDGYLPEFLREYEYEYGAVHEPYRKKEQRPMRRAEILHPLFVTKTRARPLRIAHVTDLHVDVRWDVFEQSFPPETPASLQFNNCNRSTTEIYEHARKDADVVLMTGDLIDYGRGHVGLNAQGKPAGKLGENKYYHRDRNWFLFYDVLASGDRYKRPVYTCLGNHDWRLNPYPPFAPGAPEVEEIFHNFGNYSKEKLKALVAKSHGAGHDADFSYDPKWKHLDLRDFVKVVGKAMSSSESLEDAGLPTETHIDSIAWYLLAINPFLDYLCPLPGGYRLLMLDFAKREALLADDTRLGKNYGWLNPKDGRSRGPRALSCLTKTQQWMVSQLTQLPGKAKVIGIHVPPLGPYPDWSEADLVRGFKTYAKPLEARGPTTYRFEPIGGGPALKGHPLFAIRPAGDVYGVDAEYGSFRTARDTFIRELAKPSAGVQLVFSGHIHRNDLLAVYIPSQSGKANLKGQYLLKSVAAAPPGQPGLARSPQIYTKGTLDPRRITDGRAPLYVNTTCAGPLGNYRGTEREPRLAAPGYAYVELASSGVIEKVAFRFPVSPSAIGQIATASMAGSSR